MSDLSSPEISGSNTSSTGFYIAIAILFIMFIGLIILYVWIIMREKKRATQISEKTDKHTDPQTISSSAVQIINDLKRANLELENRYEESKAYYKDSSDPNVRKNAIETYKDLSEKLNMFNKTFELLNGKMNKTDTDAINNELNILNTNIIQFSDIFYGFTGKSLPLLQNIIYTSIPSANTGFPASSTPLVPANIGFSAETSAPPAPSSTPLAPSNTIDTSDLESLIIDTRKYIEEINDNFNVNRAMAAEIKSSISRASPEEKSQIVRGLQDGQKQQIQEMNIINKKIKTLEGRISGDDVNYLNMMIYEANRNIDLVNDIVYPITGQNTIKLNTINRSLSPSNLKPSIMSYDCHSLKKGVDNYCLDSKKMDLCYEINNTGSKQLGSISCQNSDPQCLSIKNKCLNKPKCSSVGKMCRMSDFDRL